MIGPFFDRMRSIASPDFNRWLVPPAALSIHLCIGQVYAFSVFNLPLNRLIGKTSAAEADWSIPAIGWIFSIALAVLGLSAAILGPWVESAGPRRAMAVATCCFSGGFFVAALGISMHALWLVYLGYGVLGGIGLGIGYISPVSTLIKWFPDRPGMATGMAIMGFGGGAMIGSPLAVWLLSAFRVVDPQNIVLDDGVMRTFMAMGALYGLFMVFGVLTIRLPPPGWRPPGFTHPEATRRLVAAHDVGVDRAWRTPQFWLLWIVLCMNVTAGIGVLGQASLMIQEMFSDRHIDAKAAAGFVGLLSLANLAGRFLWSSLSDMIGRKSVYAIFFVLGSVLYACIPTLGMRHNLPLFVVSFCIILSMYGGGFAAIPAYLRDLFGGQQVGAIHGRLLTAWSVAAVFGPITVNYLREYQIAHGVAKAEAYSMTMYIMAGLLVIGYLCNSLVREVKSHHHTTSMPSPEV